MDQILFQIVFMPPVYSVPFVFHVMTAFVGAIGIFFDDRHAETGVRPERYEVIGFEFVWHIPDLNL